MSVDVRIKSEIEKTAFNPDPSGERTIEIDIPNHGITLDEVLEHRLVEDAYAPSENEDEFHLYVSVEDRQNDSGAFVF
ncbi:hypothetical protein [Halorubrum distributum]|uniref:hypothetical protein n=1 Tax=Halorubrum distributum TaxID=29283 RepID=UPI001269288D|nr:hypothetical protein [Halorubrum arcis]